MKRSLCGGLSIHQQPIRRLSLLSGTTSSRSILLSLSLFQSLARSNPSYRSLVIGPTQSRSEHQFPAGFSAAGVRCGIKKKKDVLDFAMIASSHPCSAGGVFTTNRFQAAPVQADKETIKTNSDSVYGVIVNSGCANACTGSRGLSDAKQMQLLAANSTAGLKNCLIMSTGVIGPYLDMSKISTGIHLSSSSLSSSYDGWSSASRAIMTTDTVPKLRSSVYSFENGSNYRVAGMCKGAGMIHPMMATMLAVITTDVKIEPKPLQAAIQYAADRSFNSISVDGDTSTNDSMLVLANGQSPSLAVTDTITSIDSPNFIAFRDSLTDFSISLAKDLVRDGEGATKFVTIEVVNGISYGESKQVCQSIAKSALVKTAMYGQDANWGRIICAVGYSGVDINPNTVSLSFVDTKNDSSTNNLSIFKNGQPYDTNEHRATELLKNSDIHLRIDLGRGKESATMWTCDYSVEYIHINADYRS